MPPSGCPRWSRDRSGSASRPRPTWKPRVSSCSPGKTRTARTDTPRPSGARRGCRRASSIRTRSRLRGSPVTAPPWRVSACSAATSWSGSRAGARPCRSGSGTPALPRRRRPLRPARLRAPDAARDAAHGRLLERGGAAGPAEEAGGDIGTERLLTVMKRLKEGRTARGIANAVWGAGAVAGGWGSESWMRAQVRRWIPKARALDGGGWRGLVP